MAIYRFLDSGERGENIEYWRASYTTIATDYDDDTPKKTTKMGRARSLSPLEEFFIVM
jgi:hypothetical protein